MSNASDEQPIEFIRLLEVKGSQACRPHRAGVLSAWCE